MIMRLPVAGRLFLEVALCLAAGAFFCNSTSAQSTADVKLPDKSKFHLFLLAGQSNMAGRGDVEAADKVPRPRVFMLAKDGSWKPASDPIHYDKPSAGVGPGRTFALALAEADTNISIGLIPAACGGSPISTWQPGAYFRDTDSHPYDDAIERTKLAMRQGTLKAILWHQGESDAHPEFSAVYHQKLTELITRFRKDLGDDRLPVIIGQLGQFPSAPWTDDTRRVNAAHLTVVKELPALAFVSSDGLSCKPDNLHFDAKSQREFGHRYANAYLKLIAQH